MINITDLTITCHEKGVPKERMMEEVNKCVIIQRYSK